MRSDVQLPFDVVYIVVSLRVNEDYQKASITAGGYDDHAKNILNLARASSDLRLLVYKILFQHIDVCKKVCRHIVMNMEESDTSPVIPAWVIKESVTDDPWTISRKFYAAQEILWEIGRIAAEARGPHDAEICKGAKQPYCYVEIGGFCWP